MTNSSLKSQTTVPSAGNPPIPSENSPLLEKVSVREFNISKQATLFKQLKKNRFTGQLILNEHKSGKESLIYLYLGRIIYANGGSHTIRRLNRNLRTYCPEIDLNQIPKILPTVLENNTDNITWEYKVLSYWFNNHELNREQLTDLISNTISEVLFDVIQAGKITYTLKPCRVVSIPLVVLDAERIIVKLWKFWQEWQGAKLADRSPNLAPIITKPQQLQSSTSPVTHKLLRERLNGQNSLRDLAVILKQNLMQVTHSLMIYVQWGFVELREIPDFPDPSEVNTPNLPVEANNSESDTSKGILVACVDDNPMVCQRMERIITEAGYDYVSMGDGFEALAHFLAKQPDVIFVNPSLPSLDGFEICKELRSVSLFDKTAIIILNESRKLTDRIKVKLAGFSAAIPKPLQQEAVMAVLKQHLPELVAA